MKRFILVQVVIAALSLAAFSFSSCQKAETIGDDQPICDGETVELNVVGVLGELDADEETRASALPVFRINWEGGEKVIAYSYTGTKLGTLTAAVVSGTDGREATLSGSITKPSTGKVFLVYSEITPTVQSNVITFNLSSQTSTDNNRFVAYSIIDVSGTVTTLKVPFTFATSIVKVNASGLPAGSTVSSAYITDIENACKLTLSQSSITVSGSTMTTSSSITRSWATAKTVSSDGKATFYFCVPKITAKSERKLRVNVSNKYYSDYCVVPSAHSSGSYVNIICEVRLPNYIDGGYDYGEGLFIPGTGVLWAPVNCGYRSSHYNYGKLYQWGRRYGQGINGDMNYPLSTDETLVKSKASLTVGNYIENMYKFYYGNESWCSSTGTAKDTWFDTFNPCPEGWRVPTKEEFAALCKNESDYVDNGTSGKGYYFSGNVAYASATSTQKLFLPLTGYRDASSGSLMSKDNTSMYWTSDAYNDVHAYAFHVQKTTDGAFVCRYVKDRGIGGSVRCVQK